LAVEEAIQGFESFRGLYQRVAAAPDRRASYEFYVEILMRLREKTKNEAFEVLAFEAAEAARFRTLLDDVGESHASRRPYDPVLLERKTVMENRLNALELQRWALPVASEKIRQIDREVRELESHLAVVRRDLQASSERALSKPLSLAEVQRSLDPDSLLLVYFLGKDRSFLWEVARDRFITHPLDDRSEIEAAAILVKKVLSRQSSPPEWRNWALPLKSLSELVLSPVADRLRERTLIIDPDGALNVVPFAALLDPRTLERKGLPGDGQEGPRFLVFDHETVIVPSVSLIVARREALSGRSPAPGVIAVLSDPVFDLADLRVPERLRSHVPVSEFPRLKGTEDEAEAILAVVPRGQALDARSFQANRALATSPELGQYQILHFATHGWLRDRPDLSGIVLSLIDESGKAQDGFLRAFEIYDLDISSDLVVPSAVSQAPGKWWPRSGLSRIARRPVSWRASTRATWGRA
jgi:CHAT domain-containing protein